MPYAVWDNGLAEMPVSIPQHEHVTHFNSFAESIFDAIAQNNEEMICLRKMQSLIGSLGR